MSTFSANTQYDYTIEILGNFSGGSITQGGPANGVAPHPVYTDANGVEYVQTAPKPKPFIVKNLTKYIK